VENKLEAIALKSKIDEILKPGIIESPEKKTLTLEKEKEE
jgi:hypothetical protein